jgi:TldD protein
LSVALSRGGDYADVFFEYRASASLSFEEGITRSAARGVSLGVGVRVQSGEATGYAYVEDLAWEALERAAKTAAQIAAQTTPGPATPVSVQAIPSRYELPEPTIMAAGERKRALLTRASEAALAFDSRITKAEASFVEELREILVATSTGSFVHDIQPLMRFGIRALAETSGRRESGRSGGGGRMTLAYFDDKSPEFHARVAAEQALTNLDAREAPAGPMAVVLAPGDSGILLHEAVGHGLEADFNRRGTSNYTGQVGKEVASALCTVVDDPTFVQGRGTINVDDEGARPEPHVLIEDGKLCGYMHDRLSARHFKTEPTGNGRRESYASTPMPRMTNTVLRADPCA